MSAKKTAFKGKEKRKRKIVKTKLHPGGGCLGREEQVGWGVGVGVRSGGEGGTIRVKCMQSITAMGSTSTAVVLPLVTTTNV